MIELINQIDQKIDSNNLNTAKDESWFLNTMDKFIHSSHFDDKQDVPEYSIKYIIKNIIAPINQIPNTPIKEVYLRYLKKLPYKEYLKTKHWDITRRAMLKANDYQCSLCKDKNVPIHIHHRNYNCRGEESAFDLIAFCDKCHAEFHDKA